MSVLATAIDEETNQTMIWTPPQATAPIRTRSERLDIVQEEFQARFVGIKFGIDVVDGLAGALANLA